MRYDAKQLSIQPNWDGCYQILNQLQMLMLQRFPIDATLVQHKISRLKKRLQLMNISQCVLGQAILSKTLAFARTVKKRMRE